MSIQWYISAAVLYLVVNTCSASTFGIWPGTKWCGLGNTSKSYDDLVVGSNRPTDMCCREHDHCEKMIPPFQYKFNALNWNLFTMLECKCDEVFYNCLKAQGDDLTANGVGVFYFNKLVKHCFNYDPLSGKSTVLRTPKWEEGKWNIY